MIPAYLRVKLDEEWQSDRVCHPSEFVAGAEWMHSEMEAKTKKLVDRFHKIVGLTHSWIVTPQTAIDAPLFDRIRSEAKQALAELGEY